MKSDRDMSWSKVFAQLGASAPADWVLDGDDREEARAQLLRFLFLRGAVRSMASTEHLDWIENEIANAQRDPGGPMAGGGLAMSSMLEQGVRKGEIAELVRATQAATIFDLCYLLSGGEFEEAEEELAAEHGLGPLGWALVALAENEAPGDMVIAGLHESVLAADPEGRQMRPRPAD